MHESPFQFLPSLLGLAILNVERIFCDVVKEEKYNSVSYAF